MSVERYSLIQRLLHWGIALLVILALIGGTVLWQFGFVGLRDTVGIEMTNTIYTAHKTLGVSILALMLIRVAVRKMVGVPAPVASLTPFERMASEAVHVLLYVSVIGMAMVGWLATGAGGFPVDFFNIRLPGILSKNEALSETLFWLHGAFGLAIAGLVTLHVAGAIMHWKVKRDGVMQRML